MILAQSNFQPISLITIWYFFSHFYAKKKLLDKIYPKAETRLFWGHGGGDRLYLKHLRLFMILSK